jgi:predicted nucleic acid-binding protein
LIVLKPMPAEPVFFDSNIICYLFGADPAKADLAVALLEKGGHVSVQVLAEVTNVARRKARLDWEAINEIIDTVVRVCVVHDLSLAVHERARAIAQAQGFSIYDSQIIAAALGAGCETLWSEDMQDGQIFEARLRISNPFATV